MDVNEFMKKSLENQAQHTSLLERIAEGIENLVASGIHVASFTLPENFDLKQVGNVLHATGGTGGEAIQADTSGTDDAAQEQARQEAAEKEAADKKAAADKAAAEKKAKDEKAAADKKAKEEADAKAAADKKASEGGGKKYTADDARKALKAFAAIEGNDAAMALLESLEVASVSELAEKGSDAIAELIKKAGGK